VKTKLQVKQIRSLIGEASIMAKRVRGLGLSGVNTQVTVANTPSFRGAIKKVLHLVEVVEI
jgi:large subunit ribosomal protein L30